MTARWSSSPTAIDTRCELARGVAARVAAGESWATTVGDGTNQRMSTNNGGQAAPQLLGDLQVADGTAGLGVDQEQDVVRLLDGAVHLLFHERFHALRLAAEAAGVHQQVRMGAEPADPVLAVAGEARLVGYQCVPAAGQAVEQGGLAHVGAAHQGDDREHGSIRKTRRA